MAHRGRVDLASSRAWRRTAALVLAWLGYATLVVVTGPQAPIMLQPLLVVPAALGGWWFGRRAGLLSAVAAALLTSAVHFARGADWQRELLVGASGYVVLGLVGFAAGVLAENAAERARQGLVAAERAEFDARLMRLGQASLDAAHLPAVLDAAASELSAALREAEVQLLVSPPTREVRRGLPCAAKPERWPLNAVLGAGEVLVARELPLDDEERRFVAGVAGLVGHAIDHHAQRVALAEAEERARRLADAAFDGIAIHEGGVVREVSPAFARLFGYKPEEMVGTLLRELVDASSEVELARRLRAPTDEAYPVVGIKRDGGRILLEVQARDCTYHGRPARAAAVRDITLRVAAERALRESEERFRTLFENVTIGLYRTTPDGRILLANPALVKMLGCASLGDLLATDLNAQDGAITGSSRAARMARVAEEGEVVGLEARWRRKDGHFIDVRESARSVRGPDGRVMHIEGTVEDVTDRKRAEAALAREEARRRGVLAASLDAIVTYDEDGRIIEWNPAAEALFGVPRAAAEGTSITRFLGERVLPSLPRGERTAWRADGTPFPAELTIVRVEEGGAPTSTAFLRDLTEHKRLEEERRAQAAAVLRTERLSALGTLVAGVAHEINNPLTYISGNIELAMMDVREAAKRFPPGADGETPDLAVTARALEQALGGADRIAQITRALRAVARQRSSEDRAVVNVAGVVRDAGALLQVALPEHVQLDISAPEDELLVEANVAELHQVVLNLARNALDALRDQPRGRVRLEAAREGDEAVVRVLDDGPGIPPEVAARLFTPFFTTKPDGTGLGLSIVHGIVRDHGGDISFATRQGGGTTFVVRLPLAGRLPAVARPTGAMDGRLAK